VNGIGIWIGTVDCASLGLLLLRRLWAICLPNGWPVNLFALSCWPASHVPMTVTMWLKWWPLSEKPAPGFYLLGHVQTPLLHLADKHFSIFHWLPQPVINWSKILSAVARVFP